MQPTQFKDAEGDIWTLSINIKSYLTIKQKFGIDISDVFSTSNNWLAQLAAQDDLMQLLGILVEITSVTREKKGLSEDDFYARLDGESIEAATDAFIQAVVLFLPAHKRTAMETVLEAVEMGMKKTEATLKASKATLVEKVSKAMDAEAKKAMDDLQS